MPMLSKIASRTNRTPQPLPLVGTGSSSGVEVPIVILRVQIISCQNLEAKDRNGYCDSCALAYISLSYCCLLIFPPLPSPPFPALSTLM